MSIVLAVAPHPDDEMLGCGGTLLRHRAEGDQIHWLIVTSVTEEFGWTGEQRTARETAIERTRLDYGFSSVMRLDFPTARLDTLSMADLIPPVTEAIVKIHADTIYVPYPGDAHSDHRVVFEAVSGATKNFRMPFVRRLLCCEILSETDFGVHPDHLSFQPNVFVDITGQLEEKIRLLDNFSGEMRDFPFPRSREAVRALAMRRGVQAGVAAAEAFMLVKELR